MSEEQEQEKEKTGLRKKSDEKPVFSQYSQIRWDIYDIFHRFTEEMGVMYGLQDLERTRSKDYKDSRARAIAYAVQFYSKAAHQFPETMKLIQDEDRAFKRYDNAGNDITKEYLDAYGDVVKNYYELMRRVTNGVLKDSKKDKWERFTPNMRHFSFLNDFMGRFMHASGIGSIEGRYQDEKNEFGYGG